MAKDDVDDPLKPLSEVLKPDTRYLTDGISLKVMHDAVSAIVLHPNVPAEVRQLFETAKNLSLYSWFVYRFHQPAELIAYSALEMALGMRFKVESPGVKVRGLKDLLEAARDRKWIANERFPNRWERAYRNAQHKKSMELILSGVLSDGVPRAVEEPTEEEIQLALEELDEVGATVGYANKLRNYIAHGSSSMHPTSISTLRNVAEVIDQIFTKP